MCGRLKSNPIGAIERGKVFGPRSAPKVLVWVWGERIRGAEVNHRTCENVVGLSVEFSVDRMYSLQA